MTSPIDLAAGAADAIADAVRGLDVPDSVRRALSCENTGTYHLGAGGRDPAAQTPLDAAGRCDCSGLLSWCWNEPRHDPADGEDEIAGDWIYTDSLYADARGPQRFGREIAAPHVQVGDALVFPGLLRDGERVRIGHCAIVVARPEVVHRFADVAVIECQSSAKPAIRRRDGSLWDRKSGIGIRRV